VIKTLWVSLGVVTKDSSGKPYRSWDMFVLTLPKGQANGRDPVRPFVDRDLEIKKLYSKGPLPLCYSYLAVR
jgi:hypothetical protein